MAAPRGNQFWKLRSKHGRDKLFASPKLLWEAAGEYFTWCDRHPWRKNEAVKSGALAGTIVKIPTTRPYSLTGLCIYLGCNSAYFRQFKRNCTEDFSTVITLIEEVIETQQFEGALVNAFNASIVASKLGIAKKVETENKISLDTDLSNLSDAELKQYHDLLAKAKGDEK